MDINGYTLTLEKITEAPAKGQWRARLNGKTVAVCRRKTDARDNGEYLARSMPAAMLAALTHWSEQPA